MKNTKTDESPSVVPGRPGPSVQDVDMPVNARKDTEKAAEAAIDTSKGRDFTASVEKGADKDFNTWMRKAHENGNPEQLTPMQAEQNIRDKAKTEDGNVVSKVHDMSDEDTRWVVDHKLAS
jgi:hypothetical protein